MAPHFYIQARNQQVACSEIDGRPYLALQTVNATDLETVRRTVVRMFLGESIWQEDGHVETTRALQVDTVTGGITNVLYRVSGLTAFSIAGIPDACLVRVFGAEGMIDRDVENCVFAELAKTGLAPPYWGRFANGRIEGWLQGMRPLKIRELSDPVISKGIAVATARFHSTFELPQKVQDYLATKAAASSPNSSSTSSKEPSMWPQLQSWLEQACAATFQNDHDTQRAKDLTLAEIRGEFAWLKNVVIPANAAAVFCHNDLLAANIMYNDQGQNIQLIDFEYGGLNYRAFDIANHFNEFAGGTEDGLPIYEWFPNEQKQTAFITAYLEAANDKPPTQAQVQEMTKEVQAFLLANNLYWGLWAVNQAATEGCQDFDYLLYGTNRIQRYYKCKDEWL